MKFSDKVDTVMSRKLLTCSPDTTLDVIISDMVQEKASSMIVIEHNSLVGIITERDLVHKVLFKARDPLTLNAKEIMTSAPLVTIPAGSTVLQAMKIMKEHRVKTLPVMHMGKVEGLVTQTDIIHGLQSMWEKFAMHSV